MTALALLLFVPAQLPTVPAEGFPPGLQKAVLAATVRVVNPERGRTGSGVVLGRSGPFVYFLTAAHVVAGADKVEVHTFAPASYPKPENVYRAAAVLARAAGDDLALVRVTTGDPVPGSLKLCPAGAAPRGSFPALTAGCDDDGVPTCLPARVTGKKRVRKAGEERAAWLWELREALAPGRSGGPLLDRQGRLLGIASIAGGGRSYCCPVEAVHALLRDNGLRHLAGARAP